MRCILLWLGSILANQRTKLVSTISIVWMRLAPTLLAVCTHHLGCVILDADENLIAILHPIGGLPSAPILRDK